MPDGVNTRILIVVWLVAGLVVVWGGRFALDAWIKAGRVWDVPPDLVVMHAAARSAIGILAASGSVFSAMFITARMRVKRQAKGR